MTVLRRSWVSAASAFLVALILVHFGVRIYLGVHWGDTIFLWGMALLHFQSPRPSYLAVTIVTTCSHPSLISCLLLGFVDSALEAFWRIRAIQMYIYLLTYLSHYLLITFRCAYLYWATGTIYTPLLCRNVVYEEGKRKKAWSSLL